MSTLEVDHPVFEYPEGPSPVAGRCHLRLYAQGTDARGGRDVVLVATDLGAGNPGASVTHAIARIVTAAVRRYGLDPARVTVLEHYDDRWAAAPGGARRPRTPAELAPLIGRDAGESFDLVTFDHVPKGTPRAAWWAAAHQTGAAAVRAADAASAAAPAPYSTDPLGGDAFDGPSWRRLTRDQAERIVGQPLP